MALAHRGFEHGRPVGRAPPAARYGKLNRSDGILAVGERVGDGGERGRVHVGARAVREQHGAVGAALRALVSVDRAFVLAGAHDS